MTLLDFEMPKDPTENVSVGMCNQPLLASHLFLNLLRDNSWPSCRLRGVVVGHSLPSLSLNLNLFFVLLCFLCSVKSFFSGLVISLDLSDPKNISNFSCNCGGDLIARKMDCLKRF
jgi:hypothetical protein